jgi:YesN/AraC family two-component response regulator
MDTPTKIMVVEDSSRARHALMAYMSLQAGMRISDEASNGREAINKIKSSPPDIVIMDMQMPVMDGLIATRIIKEHWPQIKVIALTMYRNYQSEALSAGADAFLVKGCSAAELISTIYSICNKNSTDNLQR